MTIIYLSLLFSSLIISCSNSDSENIDDDLESTQKVNGDLEGRLFIGGDGEGWILDISTGIYNRIPGVDWENKNGTYHALADFSASSIAYNGNEFLTKITKCQKAGDDPLSGYDDCLVIYGVDGTQKQGNHLFEDILGEPKLSRDGQLMAFFYDHDKSDIDPALVIISRDFEPISAISSPGFNVSPSLSWLPDNRIVYDRQQSIYITNNKNTVGTPIVTFDENQGQPKQVTVSLDGKKIAFILQTDATFRTRTATPWIINIDGSGLRQLAQVEAGRRPSFENLAWSPDGKYIFFTHGHVAAATTTDLGLIGGGYVIPSDSNNLVLNDDHPDIIHIRSYFAMKQGRSNVELTTDFSVKEGTVAWIP
ncbi:TolB family protein [Aquimarina algicola]|nr:hypothetical protein [Aquimarina algicola]